MLSARDAIDAGVPNPLGASLANLSIVFACLSSTFVVARILTRIYINKLMGIDDYLIIVAAMLAIAMTVSYNGEARNGFGFHTKQVNYPHKVQAFKWFFVAQLLYKIAAGVTKASLLLLYRRIFSHKRFRIAVWVVMGVLIAYTVAALAATIWQCDPIEKAWNKKVDGHCISISGVWYGNSVMTILTDLAIIILPVREILRLNMPMAQKASLAVLFSLGFFVMACTIVRMVTVGPAVSKNDTLHYQAISNSWTFVEINVGIICACLPVMKSLLLHFFPRVFRSRGTTSGRSNQYGNKYGTQDTSQSDWRRSRAFVPIGKQNVDKFGTSVKTKPVNGSDEEIMLGGMGVQKKTDIRVSYANFDPEKDLPIQGTPRDSL